MYMESTEESYFNYSNPKLITLNIFLLSDMQSYN